VLDEWRKLSLPNHAFTLTMVMLSDLGGRERDGMRDVSWVRGWRRQRGRMKREEGQCS